MRKRLTKPTKIKYQTIIPVIKTIVDFMSSCISGDNENDKIISKCLINLLLNFLMVRLKTVGDDVLSLKYSTSKLIISILQKFNNDETMMSLNQNGLELRTIYEYTIHFTKIQLVTIIHDQNLEISDRIIRYKKKRYEKNKKQVAFTLDTKLSKMARSRSKGPLKFKRKGSRNPSVGGVGSLYSNNTLKAGNRGGAMSKVSMIGRKLFQINSIMTTNKAKKDDTMELDMENTHITDYGMMIYAYSMTTYLNTGFHFINSLVTMMTEFEKYHGGKYWTLRKKESTSFGELGNFEQKKMSVDVREELAVVHFLTEINREIEIIDRKGNNKILLFQKFPELVNIKEFIVEQFFSDFDGEMILHKMMQYIP